MLILIVPVTVIIVLQATALPTRIFAQLAKTVQVQEQLLTVRLLLLIPKILLEQIPVQVLVNIVQLAETVPL